MNIEFFNEETDFELDQQEVIRTWIAQVIHKEGYSLEQLNYIFCSDNYLHKINLEYLNHDNYTDIITFNNSDRANEIDSDIFISIERVLENSSSQSTSFEDELARVIIHGVLHLMGWEDHTEQQKQSMREKEDACLSLR